MTGHPYWPIGRHEAHPTTRQLDTLLRQPVARTPTHRRHNHPNLNATDSDVAADRKKPA